MFTLMMSMDLDALNDAFFLLWIGKSTTLITSVGLDAVNAVNTRFYPFILYFILFKGRLLKKTLLDCSFC